MQAGPQRIAVPHRVQTLLRLGARLLAKVSERVDRRAVSYTNVLNGYNKAATVSFTALGRPSDTKIAHRQASRGAD
jgi:hypothetical protein